MLNSNRLPVITLFLILSFSCQKKENQYIMYCKSKEVLVLEQPFDKSSAKIMIYRGDEVKLLGDTIFKKNNDSIIVDSTQFYVKVSAKRGVIGWVFHKDLQKDKIILSQKQKIQKKKQEKLINIDSLNNIEDSITNHRQSSDSVSNDNSISK